MYMINLRYVINIFFIFVNLLECEWCVLGELWIVCVSEIKRWMVMVVCYSLLKFFLEKDYLVIWLLLVEFILIDS